MDSSQNETLCQDAGTTTINLSDPILAEQWTFTEVDDLLYTFLSPAVTIIGAVGNSAFLILLFAIPRMQSSVTALMSNLAVTDIMFLIITQIWAFLDYVTSKVALDYPVKSHASCVTFLASVTIPYYASLGFVTLISVERYLAICMPLQHKMMKGRKRTARLIAAAWFIGFTVGIIFAFGYKLHKTCVIWPDNKVFQNLPVSLQLCREYSIFPQVISVSLFLLCFVINAALACKIVSAMMKRKITSHHGRQEMISAKNQVTRTLVLNNTIFFLCQLPIRFVHLSQILESIGVDILNRQQYFSAYNIGIDFMLLNSCINPFLYVSCCRVYRDAFKQIFCRCFFPRNRHSDQNEIHRR